uniref:WxxW domain-containing protein n=1 Tax=Periophthalmus magnuspinnatus TaxID=409849 RepID=A0A3B4BA77_9GOBI
YYVTFLVSLSPGLFRSMGLIILNYVIYYVPSFLVLPECWTQWFDRDDPAGSGDWETLINLHLQNPGKICTKPLQIQVKTTSGQSVSSTGNVIYNDTTTGFICRNSDQRKGLCSDYMVRFRCPPDFCKPPPQCWTDWFDRDDPSGTGDYETLPQLRSQYPGQICTKPLQIQVETKGGVPLSATGDVIYKADTVSGFICRNADQKKGRCRDYKVRFILTTFCLKY